MGYSQQVTAKHGVYSPYILHRLQYITTPSVLKIRTKDINWKWLGCVKHGYVFGFSHGVWVSDVTILRVGVGVEG